MTAKIEFFPVDNGDMTLITLESGRVVMIDINMRKSADDENDDEVTDVATMLKDRLERDSEGRRYVDVFLLTHPDQDHCRGLDQHFHLGKPGDWKKDDDKIFVREMWSSPIIFRRKKKMESLCEDAEDWWEEARRRVNHYKTASDKTSIKDGDRIQVLGEDKDGKTDELIDILVKTDSEVTKICGTADKTFKAWLLGPHLVSKEEANQLTGKNHSSVVLRFSIKAGGEEEAALFLTGGDSTVESWERIWRRNKDRKDRLSYNILQTPHHCSWRSLSYDSWSEKKEEAKVSDDARSSMSQACSKGFIVASSKKNKDDDDDPPCIRAKREYESIIKGVSGEFVCVAEECENDVLLFEIGPDGPKRGNKGNGGASAGLIGIGLSSGTKMTDKKGGGRYA